MAEESTIRCPLCGNSVPPGFSKCPICATELQKIMEKRATAKAVPSAGQSEDYLHKELPKINLPVAKHACPQCALELQGGEMKCPRCGIPLATASEMLECPECGALAPQGARTCPSCGVGFEEEPEVPGPAPTEEVPPPAVFEPVAPPQKLIEPAPEVVTSVPAGIPSPVSEGLINGRGAVNGTGLVNGRGAVNGTGLVNGTGMTNGTRIEGRLTKAPAGRLQAIRRWQFLSVLVALAIIIPTFIYLAYSNEGSPIAVDGKFSEWAHVQKYGMYVTGGSTQTSVDQWAVETQANKLFLYVKTKGELMGSSTVNSLYLFIDSDNSTSTGYRISGIGANTLLEIDGWNKSVQSSSISRYDSISDQYDWNSWVRTGSLDSIVSGNQLEAMADLPAAPNAKFLLFTQDNIGSSVSYPVQETGGLLVIKQEPGSGIESTGVVAQSTSVPLLKLTFTCEGKGGTVSSVVPTVYGASLVSTFEGISLALGQERTIDVLVDTSSLTPGASVAALLSRSGVTSTFADIRIVGGPTKAYVAAPPATIQIDGAFADWAGRTTPDTDAIPVGNDNIDISAVGAVNETQSAFFYVSVVGEMCGGSYVPTVVVKPSGGGGGGGTIIPTRKTGEDILRIYIDSDLSNVTGYQISFDSRTIGADYMVEIRGLDGEIKNKTLMSYGSSRWNVVAGAVVDAANDYYQIELGMQATLISGSSSWAYVVETTDWSGRSDLSSFVPPGVRTLSGGLPASAPGMDGWIIAVSTTNATAMSYQRKLLYDGTNFWSFFWDGTNTVYKYSTDNGVTWNLVGAAFHTAGVRKVSTWYDSANNLLYAVGDTVASSRNVYLQRGTVAPATHSITWSGVDRTLAASQNSAGLKNAFISKDVSGYLWVMSSNLTQTTPSARYDLSAFRSSAADSITSFVYRGNMLSTDSTQSNIKGSILPAGSGSNMWAVYGYDGNVGARKYTGTWSAQSNIYTQGTGDDPSNTDNAPPCAVVDAHGVIHVVYGNGYIQTVSKPRIYYVYNNGAWSAPYRLEAVGSTRGNLYPTISLDSSTGNVYAFWIQTNTNGDGITVMGKKNVTGTWSALTLNPQTADAKQYLESIYSVSGATHICWQWTQNTTAPIQVIFDKIPEFGHVLIPVFFMLMVVAVGIRRSTRKRNPSA